MELELTPAQIALTIYSWLLILGGLLAVIFDLQSDMRKPPMLLRSWNLSWLNFGLGAWVLIIGVFSAQIVVHTTFSAFDGLNPDSTLYILLQGIAFQGTILLGVVYVFSRQDVRMALPPSPERISMSTGTKLVLRCLFSATFLAILVGLGWQFVLSQLANAGLVDESSPQELVEIFSEAGLTPVTMLLLALAVVIAPISEEFVFRVGLYRFLKGRFSARIALVFSSLLFSFMHFNVLSFLPLFLIGMLLCRAYERSGNIYVPIIMHALFNANNIILLLLMGQSTMLEENLGSSTILGLPWALMALK